MQALTFVSDRISNISSLDRKKKRGKNRRFFSKYAASPFWTSSSNRLASSGAYKRSGSCVSKQNDTVIVEHDMLQCSSSALACMGVTKEEDEEHSSWQNSIDRRGRQFYGALTFKPQGN
jgi:hypothetical protein